MNVLFLIGNGFDLNLGLKTRYKDVLQVYLNTPNDDPRIKKFKKDIDLDLENWSDFEKQMGIYTGKFIRQNIDDYYYCIKDFRRSLVEHLKKEELRINYDIHQENITSVFRRSITEFYSVLTPASIETIKLFIQNNSIQYNFINYNYTNILEKCIEIAQIAGKILHIHGTTQENVIMGVDHIEQIKNTELAEDNILRRTIIKPIINERLKKFK